MINQDDKVFSRNKESCDIVTPEVSLLVCSACPKSPHLYPLLHLEKTSHLKRLRSEFTSLSTLPTLSHTP